MVGLLLGQEVIEDRKVAGLNLTIQPTDHMKGLNCGFSLEASELSRPRGRSQKLFRLGDHAA